MIQATLAQLHSASDMDLRVRMTDADAKQVMTKTPNVTMSVNGVAYKVYEVNPTVITDVYAVRLCKGLKNSGLMDTGVTFEV
jgi:hypothetical protein